MIEKKKETWAEKISRFSSLIVALTALITAMTSLWKAVDKRVEEAGYEALSNSIQELQKSQAALREQVLDGGGDAEPTLVASGAPAKNFEAVDAEAPVAFIGPPFSTGTPTPVATAPHGVVVGSAGIGAGVSSERFSSVLPAPAAAPRRMIMHRDPPAFVAPPKWDTVRERANSL